MLLIASFNCNAQDVTEYVGKCKLYRCPNYDKKNYLDSGFTYAANVYFETNSMYASSLTYTAIHLFNSGSFTKYTTNHGNYISFQYNLRIYKSNDTSYSEQAMFRSSQLGGSGYFAFALNGNKLYLVDLKTDDIIMTLDNNITLGTDFSIYVDAYTLDTEWGISSTPSIWLTNNGYIKYWYKSSNTSSVKSISVDPDVQDKTFNLNGIEIEDPQEGVYIKNGKKYIAK